MPRVRVLHLPSITCPRAGTSCPYLSCIVPIVELNHLLGELGDEPCVRGTIGVPIGIQVTL
jgi:hypothetical protein